MAPTSKPTQVFRFEGKSDDYERFTKFLDEYSDVESDFEDNGLNYETMDEGPTGISTTREGAEVDNVINVDIKEEAVDGEDDRMDNSVDLPSWPNIKPEWRSKHSVHNTPISEMKTPLQYFQEYVPKTMFEDMSTYTNTYALQKGVQNFKASSTHEMEILVALHIAIGVLRFPRIRFFWETGLKLPLFTNNMSRNRFFQLRNNLHLVDVLNKPNDNSDRFFKIRPIFNAVRNRCLQLPVEKEVCIDDQLLPFTGNRGIKIFVLCGKSGQAYDFLIYQGSSTEIDDKLIKHFGLGAAVVMHLSQRLSNLGHELYFDSYFSSYNLLLALREKHIFAAGTIRLNRFGQPGLSSDKSMLKKGRGTDEELVSLEDIVMVKWMDNKGVLMASNFLGVGNRDTVRRWDESKKKFVSIQRPEVIKKYNESMDGVDSLDRLISYHRIKIKSSKWALRMIFHAVELACICAWIEYKKQAKLNKEKKILDLVHFKMQIVDGLIGERKATGLKRRRVSSPPSNRRAVESRPSKKVAMGIVDHLPQFDGKEEMCGRRGCQQKTDWFCVKCKIHLCIANQPSCFIEYHQKGE